MTHALLALALTASLAGCSVFTPRPDPTRLYVLTTVAKESSAPPTGLVIGLGPVTVPPYLDRPEIMSRVSENEIRPSPNDRWGAPLEVQIARTLSHGLTAILGLDRVIFYPWYGLPESASAVEVDVYRFEITADGKALLVARWRVRPPKGGVRAHTFVKTEAAGPGTEAMVGAMSRAVAALAEEIAAAVREVDGRR